MQISRPARPVTVVRPRPAAPQPRWDRIFLEPQYADGQPYEAAAGQAEDDDTEDPPDAA